MLARVRKSIEEKDQGFTLIELLVVMIIIGILAAIAIPVFLNQRQKGYDAQAKSDVRAVQTELETYFTDAQTYPTTVSSDAMPNPPAAETVYYKKSVNTKSAKYFKDLNAYCISVQSDSGKVWKVTNASSGITAGSACTAATG